MKRLTLDFWMDDILNAVEDAHSASHARDQAEQAIWEGVDASTFSTAEAVEAWTQMGYPDDLDYYGSGFLTDRIESQMRYSLVKRLISQLAERWYEIERYIHTLMIEWDEYEDGYVARNKIGDTVIWISSPQDAPKYDRSWSVFLWDNTEITGDAETLAQAKQDSLAALQKHN